MVLDQHLLRADLVGMADAGPALAHRGRQLPFPEVDRLADVTVGVDHDVLGTAREVVHAVPPS